MNARPARLPLLACTALAIALSPGLVATPAIAQPAPAPGGLYVGYYAEDPATNPEDPTVGSLHLSLPAGNAEFSGAMNFTYLGCQSASVGVVAGQRNGDALVGSWRGTVDGLAQNGRYSGRYDAAAGAFAGTYTVAGGRQLRDLRPCIRYVIAPQGTWELFPAGSARPEGFVIAAQAGVLSWTNPPGTAYVLVAVLDEAAAQAGRPASRHQALEERTARLDFAAVPGLAAGTRYVVTVAAMGADGRRLGVTSRVVTR